MNIEEIQSFCNSLPGVTEDVKWGHDLVFSITAKMFCVVALSGTPTTASFKVPDEEFDEISNREGFKPAPYMARHKWVYIDDIGKIKKAEWKKFLRQSYDLVSQKLPAKTKKQFGIS
jgi:predicted DNA-binding protein (MmcQ/YjbR family)